LGSPAYLLFEVIGQGIAALFHSLPGIRHVEGYVERRTAGERFSVLRVAAHLGTMLLFIALGGGIYWLVKLSAQ
jgi:succinate dehydrogenase/fumarate reductase cytochrome b subunit